MTMMMMTQNFFWSRPKNQQKCCKINKNVAISFNQLQFPAFSCNSAQLLAILCNNLQFRAIAFNFLQYLAEYCATSCNLVITCNYILLFASSRSWILLNLVEEDLTCTPQFWEFPLNYGHFLNIWRFAPLDLSF